MTHYYADIEKFEALEKQGYRKGNLRLHTLIDVRGNPKKGPVPVVITFVAQFSPHERYQEIDEEDGEVNWETYWRDFKNKTERDMFVDSFFWVEGDKKRKGWFPEF